MKRQKTEQILSVNVLKRFTEIGCQKDIENPKVITKLIESTGSIVMYLTQYDPISRTAYGFVKISFMELVDTEFKYIDMDTLEEMKENGDTEMFIDAEFVECDLSDCINTNS